MTWLRVQTSGLWLGILLSLMTPLTACSFFADDELAQPMGGEDTTIDPVDVGDVTPLDIPDTDIPRTDLMRGEACSEDGQCAGDLYCANAICQDGGTGDFCNDTSDCDQPEDACEGEPRRCTSRAYGQECGGDPDCPDTLYCAGDICQDGRSGDFCLSTSQCNETDDHCAGDPQVCSDRERGDACTTDIECPSSLYCAGDLCQDGRTGDRCNSTSDCNETVDICEDSSQVCRARENGDDCAVDDDCPGELYCSNNICQQGDSGEFCDETDDCVEPDDTCDGSPGRCTNRAWGQSCDGDPECPGTLYCSNSLCQDGRSGDYCDETSDCNETNDICGGSPGQCRDRVKDDACGTDTECPGALYCANAFCQDGTTGDYCDSTVDCDENDDICGGSPGQCRDRVEGDDCGGDGECPTGLYCANAICQDGTSGDYCDSTADCDESNDICGGSPGQCRDRVDGDACGGDGECPTGLYCASSVGECRDGSTGDRCDSTLDCDDAEDICAGSPTECRTRVEGDACGTDNECPGALYCANAVCQDGTTGDFCDTTSDCDQVDDICKGSPARCQDRVEGDDCGSALECAGTAPICSTDGICQNGNTGDDCQVHDDCGVGFHCGEASECASGNPLELGETCSTDARCVSTNCSNDRCAPEGFAYIPSGTFCMGSPDGSTECMGETPPSELGRISDRETPLHEVTLTRGFFLQETEVTQRQWEAMGFSNPSHFDECGLDCPVETVNWWEAVAYVNALSESEGLTPCYTLEGTCDPSQAGTDIECDGITVSDPDASGNPYLCEGYRLPMDAEWEYAYRAGTRTAFYNGGISQTGCDSDPNLIEIAWYCNNAGSTTHIVSPLNGVDGKAPNAWGLYDMAGNVYEWVWDWYQSDYYTSSPPSDPLGGTGSYRVGRGGSWSDSARSCRAALRSGVAPGLRVSALGFRPSRSDL